VTVSFDVINTGTRAGVAVPQLYLGNPSASRAAPGERAEGILPRRAATPAKSGQIKLTLDPRAMSFFDVTSHAWKTGAGKILRLRRPFSDIAFCEYTVAP